MAFCTAQLVPLLLVISLASLGNCQSGTPCPPVNGKPTCVCSPTDGRGVIDVTTIASPVGSAPRFQSIPDQIGYAYSFNPCNPYTEKLCGNVHGCQTSDFNDEVTYSIAVAGTEAMYIDPDEVPYLYYSAFGQKETYVYLHCTDDKEPRIVAHGDEAVFNEFIFEIYSRDVCPGGNYPSAGVEAGGVGIAIIALSLVAVVVYFVLGMIVMRVKFNATGVDLIPNRAFWQSLPFLIKDGTLLVISPCKKISGSDSKDPAYSTF